ncbi:MAG: ATP-binding protein [Chloroflexota bacterium]
MIAQTELLEERAYYNISQAAAVLGVSRVSVWRWIRDGDLPAVRLGHRTTRIKREDLEGVLLRLGSKRTSASNQTDAGEHFVQFYEQDAVLVEAVASFIGAALRADDAGIVIGTEAHRTALDKRLAANGLDLAAARASGRYVSLDAGDTLPRFMVGDMPDPDLFFDVVGGVSKRTMRDGRRVRAFGEMVALLALDGKHDATVRLEELWNQLQHACGFSLFCAYPMERLAGESLADLLGNVCAEHSRVVPAESYTGLPSQNDQLRAVAALQQKAIWLEAEIAQRKQAEERLRLALDDERVARDAAESALRQRDEFLSIAAHELKTPITSMNGHAQLIERRLLRGGQLEAEEVTKAVQTITGQGRRLSRLLNQLFDVSQLQAGKLDLAPQRADLMETVRQAVENARLSSDGRSISLAGPASCELVIDALRLEQVLTNLLDNAIKYSPHSHEAIEVVVREDGTTVELSVRDHGLGIPPDKRGHIFERFYQAHTSGHRSGMGLGLYVSRQIVELHEGEIGAEFPAGGGSRFFVRLPMKGTL